MKGFYVCILVIRLPLTANHHFRYFIILNPLIYIFVSVAYKTRSLLSNQAGKEENPGLTGRFFCYWLEMVFGSHNILMELINVIRNKYLTLLVGGC